jgi:PadR family transcriptional regulator, regulatory protein PadR
MPFEKAGVHMAVLSEREFCLVLLLLLEREPAHGYSLSQKMSAELEMLPAEILGAIYRRLRQLESDGFVVWDWTPQTLGPPKKTYQLTTVGRARLHDMAAEQRRLASVFDRLLSEWHVAASAP